MVCPNCHEESNGLKLNNRLYCTECGFLLSNPNATPEENFPEITKEPKATQQNIKKIEEHFPEKEPEAKIINDEPLNTDVAPLEAELEVLDLVEKEAAELEEEHSDKAEIEVTLPKKLPQTNKTIKKHNRPRTDLKKEGDFVLIPGEPDPIAVPEIEKADVISSRDSQKVETDTHKLENTSLISEDLTQTTEQPGPTEEIKKDEADDGVADEVSTDADIAKEIIQPTNIDTPPVEKEDKQPQKNIEEVVEEVRHQAFSNSEPEPMVDMEINKHDVNLSNAKANKPKKNNEMLLSYFRKMGEQTPKKNIKSKKKKKFNWKIFAICGGVLFLILFAVGLGTYLYSVNGDEKTLRRAETKASFSHLKPTYLPPGYVIGPGSSAETDKIVYVYVYSPDRTKKLNIKAEKTNIKEDEIKTKLIDSTEKEFINKETENRSYWLVADETLYFIDSNVLYTITSNPDISAEEIYKIADGLK